MTACWICLAGPRSRILAHPLARPVHIDFHHAVGRLAGTPPRIPTFRAGCADDGFPAWRRAALR